ncbi:hypothetical protein K144316041_p21000 (plasmid) [Clostridium tetani]|uniref:hypothetical protein n=1 Tax=Clostridium tetani TaxID=1513 RepID=UPI00295296AC|nr:hypothetical protein [Clostridium tetani]BDR74261.1 hypothetical protein K144316041_p21000 [Clostridium tetani]
MSKYKNRQESIVVDAIQFIDDDYETLCAIGSMGIKLTVEYNPLRLEIDTPEGALIANKGDYVIKERANEFCLCRPDIFKRFYERLK